MPLSVTVALLCTLGAVSEASAQEWVGTEVSAAVPSLVMGSSSARVVRVDGVDLSVRGARYAICSPASGEYCDGMQVAGIEMNTFPRFKLHLALPSHFTLQGHLWSMTHEEVDMTVRQAVLGTTLRRDTDHHWYELGAGIAERAEAQADTNDPTGAHCDPGPVEPALLAGMGAWFNVGDHMFFDLRLRGGVSVGDASADVYHANLVVAFLWQ